MNVNIFLMPFQVAIIKEHFSSHGDLSTVELEDSEGQDSKSCSARISFTTRQSAEKAFTVKSWQGHNLQFAWLKSSNTTTNDNGSNTENCSSTPKASSEADTRKEEKPRQENTASGNAESENSARKSSVEHAELQEVSKPSPGEEEDSAKDSDVGIVQ